jgi:CRP-like cAMP-binding protein
VQRRQLLSFWPDTTAEALARWHLDIDQALEAAELALLQGDAMQGEPLGEAVPLAQCSLLRDLSAAQQATLIPLLEQRKVKAGERLFSEGDPGSGVYVLTRGSISIVSASGQRFMSFSPGTMLGELALLDGQGRSAHALADQDAELSLLTREALQAINASDPALCSQHYRNMALHLADRLRVASSAWRSAAS